MSDSLSSLLKKSDHERIVHVALYKRVAVSKLLSSLFTKEWLRQMALVATWVICSWFALLLKKRAICWTKFIFFTKFLTVFTAFHFFMLKNKLLPSLFFKERQERFALVTLYKEQLWANHSQCSLKKSDHERFALFQKQIAFSLFH